MTALVDIMLMLLIIFIITVPVKKHAVNMDLPRATNIVQDTKQETICVSEKADGAYFWSEQKFEDAALSALLKSSSAKPAT